MIAALALLCTAWAEPAALRAPVDAGWTVVAGTPAVSAGAWLAPGWGAWGSVRLDRGAAEAGALRRLRLAGGDTGWRLEASLGLGAVVPLVRPGIALGLTPAVVAGLHGERLAWTGGVVLPVAVGTGGVRLPALAETWLGGDIGPVWLGARLAAGGTLVPGRIPAFAAEAGLVVTAPGSRAR